LSFSDENADSTTATLTVNCNITHTVAESFKR